MESLSETTWDVLLSGTGLSQSLLALYDKLPIVMQLARALSRSGKKILHIDRNDYYGGAEAALSLQEVETWAKTHNRGSEHLPFSNVSITNVERDRKNDSSKRPSPRLGFSRAYSLSLSPQLIYTRSNLLPALVSSKVYRQLEFLAVGSWWLYDDSVVKYENKVHEPSSEADAALAKGILRRIPGGREDVFRDTSIDRRSTMSLMKFLKLAADPEAHAAILEDWGNKPFPEFLESHLSIPPRLQAPLLALTLTPETPAVTPTSYALPRIHRHLTSIGMFGPGFGSVIPKWGGLAEIAQVACRAGAVGGGVYVLKQGLENLRYPNQPSDRSSVPEDLQLASAKLEGGEEVKTRWVVGSHWDLPPQSQGTSGIKDLGQMARSISIVSGKLSTMFPSPSEGAPPPAGAVVVIPSGSIALCPETEPSATSLSAHPPVNMIIHSSDTGECPTDQCIIYAQTTHQPSASAHILLQATVENIIASIEEEPEPSLLWHMHYDQHCNLPATADNYEAKITTRNDSHVLQLPDLAPGFILEDDVLKHVKAAYDKIMRGEPGGFMTFEDREGMDDAGDGDET